MTNRKRFGARPAAIAGLVIAAALLAPSAWAQWQWRGADGRVNISDRPPPPGVPDKDILKRPAAITLTAKPAAPATPASAAAGTVAAPAAPAAASAPLSALEREVQARKRVAEAEQAAKAKAEEQKQAALRAENCKSASSAAATLQSGMRVTRSNAKGEREFLDDASRAAELARAQQAVASNCR